VSTKIFDQNSFVEVGVQLRSLKNRLAGRTDKYTNKVMGKKRDPSNVLYPSFLWG